MQTKQPMTFSAIRELLNSELIATDSKIQINLDDDVPFIKTVANHILNSGGKRLRPIVFLLTALALKSKHEDLIVLAAALEFIHTATLLHDDVVDTSAKRRNKATANAIWGNQAPILIGDFLYSRAFQMLIKTGSMHILSEFGDMTNAIAQGEVMQLVTQHNANIQEAHYMKIIKHKTAVLFETATKLGAYMGVCDNKDNVCKAMAGYGHHLGMAFQLVDDALDFVGDAEMLGKNLGDDLAEGKVTLPLIYALEKADPSQTTFLRQALQDGHISVLPDIKAIIDETGAIEYTYNHARQKANAARSFLQCLPPSSYCEALHGLVDFSLERLS